MGFTLGSLFSGYGGLDLAVQDALGADLTWYSEIEPAACTVLEAHHPGVSNLGDVTEIDWSTTQRVDILTGGYPCQPFSTAGKRKGKSDERHLWPFVRNAIDALGPRLVILENVRGHLTLGFADVLGDLATLGFNARWGVIRASDAGAPHGRARLFVIAYPEGSDWGNPQSHGLVQAGPGTTEPRERDSEDTWGTYAQAINRWERTVGRAAPQAWVDKFINPLFVEWMMGLPEGWVTGHGLTRSEELKMLGNGVVPQQASMALGYLL
jgi:DNA (cytosine-5)-methyltransferase 1